MIHILILVLGASMTGTVDQVDGNRVIVELVAKDGHTHQEDIPKWMFPCLIEEGTQFFIQTNEKNTIIRCQKN